MSAKKISAVIITLNEAAIIRQTLSRLDFCDEIVIVDSFSNDNTASICKESGCRVFQKKFNGYGEQKNFAVSKAVNDMVLCIDADEVITEELAEEIRREMLQPTADAYFIKMNFVFINKVFTRGKESRRNYIRLFDKTKGRFNNNKVHEGIELSGTSKQLKGRIWHYSYKSITHYFDKFNRYSSLGAELICEKKKKKPVALLLISFPFYFFKYYFLEQNFRNGMPGFYWSSFQSFYHFVKYAKVRERYQLDKLPREKGNLYFQQDDYTPAVKFSLHNEGV